MCPCVSLHLLVLDSFFKKSFFKKSESTSNGSKKDKIQDFALRSHLKLDVNLKLVSFFEVLSDVLRLLKP